MIFLLSYIVDRDCYIVVGLVGIGFTLQFVSQIVTQNPSVITPIRRNQFSSFRYAETENQGLFSIPTT